MDSVGAWTTPTAGTGFRSSEGGSVGEGLGRGAPSGCPEVKLKVEKKRNSTNSDISGLGKPSAGSEGNKKQKETSVGVKLGGSRMGKYGMSTCTQARACRQHHQQQSLIYCDKMNSPQVAHPAANFSSYLLCE